MTRTPKGAKPMPDGATLLRMVLEGAAERETFLAELEKGMAAAAKRAPKKKRLPKPKPKG